MIVKNNNFTLAHDRSKKEKISNTTKYTSSESNSNQNLELVDVTKKISETIAPFEKELKKLLNIN